MPDNDHTAPPPPSYDRRWWPWLVAGLAVALLIVGCCVGAPLLRKSMVKKSQAAAAASASAFAMPTPSPSPTRPPGPGAALDEIAGTEMHAVQGRRPAIDGPAKFVINRIKCGATKLGQSFFRYKAEKNTKFCIVHATLTNVGKKTYSDYTDFAQGARCSDGKAYQADGLAAVGVDSNEGDLNKKLAPGKSTQGYLVFVIPAKARLTALQLHSTLFDSDGVVIPVK